MNAVSPRSDTELGTSLAYLPIFLDLRDRIVLLIGSGVGAEPKLDLLLRSGACVRQVTSESGPLAAQHFEDAVLVVDASCDPATNARTRSMARTAGIPLNVVDRPALCDFIFPAILDRTPVIVAVSTGGLAPAIARLIRQRLETAIPAGIGRLAILAARLRAGVVQRLGAFGRSALFWEQLFEGEAAGLALAGRLDDAAILAESLIADLEAKPCADRIETLDIASDDPELLTLRAAQRLRMADVVFHEPSISAEVLALSRRDARKIVTSATPERIADGAGRAVYLRMRPQPG